MRGEKERKRRFFREGAGRTGRGLTRCFAALVTAGLLLGGCAQRDQLQPKQSNVWLISEGREAAIGEEVVKEVEREYTVYQNRELAAYVDEVGQKLAAVSDRPNVRYRFKVLDSPIANAFAVPGGHIYITRGIIGVLDDEAELGGVLGHEIGHIAARHSAKQLQNATLASIGLAVFAVLAGDKVDDDVFRAADAVATLIFLGYSRGDEDQADILGAKYLYRAGYDMEGMVGAMEGLLELQKRKPMKIEQFLQSHPLTRDRIEHIRSWLPRIPKEDVWGGTPPGTKLRNREAFQRYAAPYAIYPGEDEMLSALENYRIGLIRGQRDLLEKSLDSDYNDGTYRSREAYLNALGRLISSSRRIDYKMKNIKAEPQRHGGAAKFDYRLRIWDAEGRMTEETGRGYATFTRPNPHTWLISSLRSVPY
ncbi:MAG: hypothetical protein D6679_05855 [Candidatus Hydrogenedentota bacterium]|nr:MAG: hypothetical protein D6679_05855 [Candidatus Hydrogenedentota bacterium]